MLHIEKNDRSLSIDFSSDLTLVDLLVHILEHLLFEYEIHNLHNLLLVTMELLNNAVVHGNKNDVNRLVNFRLEHLQGSSFRIQVEDQGSGFDINNQDMSLPEYPKHIKRRGYAIINALSDRIESNSRGNCITVYMKI